MLRASVGAYRRHVGIAALFLVGHQTGEALVPVLVGVVIDEAVTPGARVVLGDRDREREVGRPEADTDHVEDLLVRLRARRGRLRHHHPLGHRDYTSHVSDTSLKSGYLKRGALQPPRE